MKDLGRPGNVLMVAAGMYGSFESAGLFASSLNHENSPRGTGIARSRWLITNGKPRSEFALVLQYFASISELHDQVDLQNQPESPVG